MNVESVDVMFGYIFQICKNKNFSFLLRGCHEKTQPNEIKLSENLACSF